MNSPSTTAAGWHSRPGPPTVSCSSMANPARPSSATRPITSKPPCGSASPARRTRARTGPPLRSSRRRIAWNRSLPDLAPYRVVVLCNVADVPPAAARTLESFVTAGGALVVFTGDRVKPEGYEVSRQGGLLPATVEGPADLGLYRFATWEKEHPLLRPFADPQSGDLRVLKFRPDHPAEARRGGQGARWRPGGQAAAGGGDEGEGPGAPLRRRPSITSGATGRSIACIFRSSIR